MPEQTGPFNSLHCLPFNQHILSSLSLSSKYFFQKYGKELQYLNIWGNYSISPMVISHWSIDFIFYNTANHWWKDK